VPATGAADRRVLREGRVPDNGGMDPTLHTTELGERGSRVVFCHGLFGQGKNWSNVAKAIAVDHRVTLVDMPNHGRSPQTDGFGYRAMADAVAALLHDDDPVALVGHSMGGKAAMVLALRHPALVERLCVVDVAPAAYRHQGEFAGYVEAMRNLDLGSLSRRSQADEALAAAVPDPVVRAFLLQNLRRDASGGGEESWRWQLNLEALGAHLDELAGWPAESVEDAAPYDGPVLWMRGESSGYVRDEHAPAMDALFPRNRRVTIKNAGHWLHSEQPQVFIEVLRRFLESRAPSGPPAGG
jgi:pimeloyl-ACP methyl ester carboxylesterase